jgi:choline dehydrogenase-like flavoprotein
MLRDARNIATGEIIEADVCIIGAGPAGISIARELIGSDRQVLLLESGGFELDPDITEMAHGESVGLPYYPLFESRAKAFGGTSHYWPDEDGLRSRPLDPIDFEQRPEVPFSGWPISRDQLDPFYERAHSVCGLGSPVYEVDEWEDPTATPRIPFADDRVRTDMFRFGADIGVFRSYRNELETAANITLLHHANVVEIVAGSGGRHVSHLEVAGLWTSAFSVRARVYVLAAGGIENARLLLASKSQHANGLGNEHDNVGRFFMEHLRVQTGILKPRDPSLCDRLGLYSRHTVGEWMTIGVLAAREDLLREAGILNSVLYLRAAAAGETADTYRSMAVILEVLKTRQVPNDGRLGRHIANVLTHPGETTRSILTRLKRGSGANRVIQLTAQAEQAPNPLSRVTLSDEMDPLGFPRARLEWQLTDLDHRSIRGLQDIIANEAKRAGIGSLDHLYGDEHPPAPIRGHWHHMGTTRMHVDPKLGVVDERCKLHGVENLFVAGSSVFPTGGYVNPTLTIVALALRLADQLKSNAS